MYTVCALSNTTDFFSECPTNRWAKWYMVVTARVCSFQRTRARLCSVSSCRFIAVEISVCLLRVSKFSTWSIVQWLDFTLNRGKLPRKCTKTWRMCTVVTVLVMHRSADSSAFARRWGVAGGWFSSRLASLRSVQWVCGESSRYCGAGQASNHWDTRWTSWSRWGSGQANFGKTFTENEDLFEVCAALWSSFLFVRGMCCTVKQFLVSKSICVIQHPPTRHIWHRQTFFSSKRWDGP